MLYEHERTINFSYAKRRIKSAIDELKLQCVCLFSDNEENVSCIELLSQGESLSIGSGKGLHHRYGAIAEALEHCFLFKENDNNYCTLPVGKVLQQVAFSQNHLWQELKHSDSHIRVVPFSSNIFVPLVLINPYI